MKLRSYVGLLVLAGAVPLIAVAGVVTWRLVERQREAIDLGLGGTVAALTAVVDNEIQVSIKSLETLAASPRLDVDDFQGFYDFARRAHQLHPWSTIGLIDVHGRHWLNVARPLGSPLPDLSDREYFKQVVATGRPYVSEPIRGRAIPTMDIAIAVPVIRDRSVKYVLFAGIDPVRLSTAVQDQALPPEAAVFIVGRDRRFIARSVDHDRYLGTAPPPAYLAAIDRGPTGTFRAPGLGGAEVAGAFRKLPLTDWIVGVEVPSAVVDAPVRRIAWTGAFIAGGLALLALGLTAVFSRRMARSIGSLSRAAAALGRGEGLAPGPVLPIEELEATRRSLADAAALLRQRDADRAELLAREQAARAEAEAASRGKDEFLAMLGHELRNPLGAIAGAVGVLNAVGGPDDRARRGREVIGRQLQHLARLVDDLLDVSRVTSGKIVLHRAPLDLGDLVSDVLTVWRSTGRLEQHDVSVDVASVWVDADEVRMEQVLSNLVGNALKYTPAGGRVTVRVAAEGEVAVLEVTDTGVGIAASLLTMVFDLFVQGERTLDRTQGGLGLGLTLVKALVRMHGGSVAVASEGVGKGAVFSVRLPRIAEPAERMPPATAAPTSGARRILVVEDNDDAREMLRTALTLQGHEVHEASDGIAGIAAAASFAPDAALIDVGLPGVDGYEVARRIRATDDGRVMLLVALTGYGQDGDRQRALDAGFDVHLTKPLAPEQVVAVIAAGRPRRGR